eukprot:11435536-Alexandrium_andersonii.AAC.1
MLHPSSPRALQKATLHGRRARGIERSSLRPPFSLGPGGGGLPCGGYGFAAAHLRTGAELDCSLSTGAALRHAG